AQRRFVDVVERGLGEKQRLGAIGLHDRDILLIGRDQNADAARVRGADKLGPRRGQMARQHVDHGRGERAVALIVALTDNQEMKAPVDWPHGVGVEVGQHRAPRGEPTGRTCRRTRTQRQQRTPIHTQLHQARRRSPPRLRVFLLRLEDVAVEDRRDTQVRYVDQLRDVEVNGYAYHRIGLFAAQALLLDQKVDRVERGVARGKAHVLGKVGERRYLLAAEIGREYRQLAFRLQRQT